MSTEAFAREIFDRLVEDDPPDADDLVDALQRHGLGRIQSRADRYGVAVELVWAPTETPAEDSD